ncbi:MAG: apolipoprotein N-acyltransferase [Elusimicrobia bacterium]|nr:apolipoprotein N-acyltransferase [Elusimicrobiota bacterium]
MKITEYKHTLFILFTAIAYPLLFPKFGFWFLAPFVFVPFILELAGTPRGGLKKAFIESWLAGILANMIVLYWIYYTLIWNGAGAPVSALGYILLCAYLGLYWGVFGLFTACIVRRGRNYMLFLVPSAWVMLEYLRAFILTGFPWLFTGYALAGIPAFIQTADVAGVYGISFAVIFVNTSVALFFRARMKRYLVIPAVLLVFLYFYGLAAMDRNEAAPDMRVSVLQGNISQYQKWDPRFRAKILESYGILHGLAARFEPGLIIWPETALPAGLTSDPVMERYMRSLVSEAGAYEVIGSIETRERGVYYNSAYLVTPQGGIMQPYRKRHLIPFGEFIPFRRLLSVFIGVLNEVGDFSPGEEAVILKAGEYNIGVGICFEGIFPGLVRDLFRKGADIFVNITNDGWYLDTAAPEQHFIHSIMRAVENRSFVIRAGNTGISAVISPSGEVLQKTELLKYDILNARAGRTGRRTLYSKYGDLPVFIMMIATLGSLLIPVKAGSRNGGE